MKNQDSLGKEKITYVEFESVVSDVKSIVSNNPDYIYPEYLNCDDCDYQPGEEFDRNYCDFHYQQDSGCRYFGEPRRGNKERPSCLVGYWLDKNGFNTPEHFGVDDLFELEGESSDKILDLLQSNTEYSFGTEVREFLASAQSHQDHYETWKLSYNKSLPRFMEHERLA